MCVCVRFCVFLFRKRRSQEGMCARSDLTDKHTETHNLDPRHKSALTNKHTHARTHLTLPTIPEEGLHTPPHTHTNHVLQEIHRQTNTHAHAHTHNSSPALTFVLKTSIKADRQRRLGIHTHTHQPHEEVGPFRFWSHDRSVRQSE